jgi:hypothetical protein
MAATSLNLVRLPVARPVVYSGYGGTMTARQITVSGTSGFVTGSYLLVNSDFGIMREPGHETYLTTPLTDQFFGGSDNPYIVVTERMLAGPTDLSAATMSRIALRNLLPTFSPDVPLTMTQCWWPGDYPSSFASLRIHDRRLEPFFDSLRRIEGGEWDKLRGRRPSKKALRVAKAVLARLSGAPVAPTKVIASNARILIYFSGDEKYSNIEILNTGAMLIINSNGSDVPEAKRFVMDSFSSVLTQISAHLT